MRKLLFVLLSILCFKVHAQQNHKIEEKSIGGYKVSIYLPPNYDPSRKYKTLYFNDGQTVFGSSGLNVDASADELINKKLIEPLIIVGIHSDYNRTSHYVPYNDPSMIQDFGNYQPQAKEYSEDIIKKIIPFIEKRYSTSSGRGIAGYSFGGLHSTWIALNYPEYFSFSGSLSPSYWVQDFKIFEEGKKAKDTQTYYFDIGTGEWNYYVPMLLHTKLPILKSIFYYEIFGSHHQISDWRGDRIKNILLLFSGNTDLTKYMWDIQLEIIKSESTGKFYPRINPTIRYSNGLQCSISYAATFKLLNTEDGVVNKDGSFRFTNPKDLTVKITYDGQEKSITVNYNEVEKIKAGL
ncbi:MAG: esterase family protein [Cyclobacteriaceae bacterium]|nr:esterase family protein [Cyclobacteriaceae bacterium]